MTHVAIVAIIVPVLLLLCIFVIVVLIIVRRRRISRNNRGRQGELPAASQEQPPNSVQLEEIGVDNQYTELNIERPPEDNYYQSTNHYEVVE